MAKYLLLKHYRRNTGPEDLVGIPMDQWSPDEIDAHITYMNDFAAKLEETGEFVDGQALSPEGTFVRYDGAGRPPVTDGPFAETKDLIAGWMIIDVDSLRAGDRTRRGAVRGPRQERGADLRVARGPAVPHRGAHGHRVSERARVRTRLLPGAHASSSWASSSVAEPTSRRPRTPSRKRSDRGVPTWPDDPPRDPKGWLVTVAWRKFLDLVRADTARRGREERMLAEPTGSHRERRRHARAVPALCAHPSLTSASAVALTLRAVGGLTTRQIAAAYLVPEATMAQRISRAKRTVSDVRFDQPGDLGTVLTTLYLVFNEGYSGDVDLAAEAIRLTRQLAASHRRTRGRRTARADAVAPRTARGPHRRRTAVWFRSPSRTAPAGTPSMIAEGVDLLQDALAA